jgi:hypothetical protein
MEKPLTEKQEAFAKALASGMDQSDAYRAAYNAENMKNETIWNKASEMLKGDLGVRVRARVDELKAAVKQQSLKEFAWTREMSVKALVGVYKEGTPAIKIQAVKELNNMHGFNAPTKQEISGPNGGPIETKTTKDMSDEELEAAMAQFAPALAKK